MIELALVAIFIIAFTVSIIINLSGFSSDYSQYLPVVCPKSSFMQAVLISRFVDHQLVSGSGHLRSSLGGLL
jgi:hypothetical protein